MRKRKQKTKEICAYLSRLVGISPKTSAHVFKELLAYYSKQPHVPCPLKTARLL